MNCTLEEVQIGPYFGDTTEINDTSEWDGVHPAKHTEEAGGRSDKT